MYLRIERGNNTKENFQAEQLALLILALKSPDALRALSGVFGFSAGYSLPPHAKGGRFHLATHHGADLIFFKAKLHFNCLKRGAVFPGHFNDAVDGFRRQLSVHTGLNASEKSIV